MAYQKKTIRKTAKEFNCLEKDLVWFFLNRGYSNINCSSSLSEDEYNFAKKHFLDSDKPSPVDYRTLLKKYDAQELKLSPIKYSKAVRSVVEELLEILRQQESAQAKILA